MNAIIQKYNRKPAAGQKFETNLKIRREPTVSNEEDDDESGQTGQFDFNHGDPTQIQPKKTTQPVVIVDKRKEMEVNRALIFSRLNKAMTVQIQGKSRPKEGQDGFGPVVMGTPIPIPQQGSIAGPSVGPSMGPSMGPIAGPKEQPIASKTKRKFIIVSEFVEQDQNKKVDKEIEPEKEKEKLEEEKVAEPEPEPEKEKENLEEEKAAEPEKVEPEKVEPEKMEPEKEKELAEPKKTGKKKKIIIIEPAPEKEKAGPDKKKPAAAKKYEYDINDRTLIDGKKVLNRLPKHEKIVMRASPYYMSNRKIFVQKLTELFKPYSKELADQKDIISCDADKSTDFKLLTHQKVVRDYLNLYTPYRGLLLYHGLGSGKSCTSIAIAEGMKSDKQIILMTPASLKSNFFDELKKCGDSLYKKDKFWEFVSTEGHPDRADILTNALNIPKEYVLEKKGAWLLDITKPESNFGTLDESQQKSLDKQLDMMIRVKYSDINYNGLNQRIVKQMTNDFTVNPFDNKVILIDEAHNFVSLISNKLKTKKSTSYFLRLYDYLMSARNARIVLLTGTPIINYPNELGILFNILRGYIKTWTFPVNVNTTKKINRDEILEMFDRAGLNTYDYVDYTGNKLVITRNPFGFIDTQKIAKRGGGSSKKRIVVKNNKTKKNKLNKLTNQSKQNVSKKSKNSVEPYTVEDGVIKINPIPELEIESEAKIERQDRVGEDIYSGGGAFDSYSGVKLDTNIRFDDTGNLTDEMFAEQVRRVLEDNDLDVIEGLIEVNNLKALPDDSATFINMFIDTDSEEMKNQNVFKKRILGLASYFRSANEKLLPHYVKTESDKIIHVVPVEMSEYQFSVYEKIRKDESDKEKSNRLRQQKMAKKGAAAAEAYAISSSYRIFSRAACNFAFPDPPGRPMPDHGKGGVDGADDGAGDGAGDDSDDEDTIDASVPEKDEGEGEELEEGSDEGASKKQMDYGKRVQAALKMLEYDPKNAEEEQYLTKTHLSKYSPKFQKILENIMDEENVGLHLLYTQFRTIEGVGLLKLILEANGFAQFKIDKKQESGLWEIVESEEDVGKPRFVLYTGTETIDEKKIILNIYNSNWDGVPASITAKLREKSSNNFYGEIIKVMMITASGAEGINLKNTRFVHIVEPYWHMVRIEQVIGRARRICSHQSLPEELRTVKVFLYLSVFSEGQKTNKQNIEMMIRDVSRMDGRPVTTDESLFDNASIKDKINSQLLKAIKESSIDCTLFSENSRAENLVCYGYGKVTSNQFGSYPTLEQDLGEKEDINARKEVIKMKVTKEINGIKYAVDPNTNNLYDLESYYDAQKNIRPLVLVGRLVKSGKQFIVEKI
jgi:hypothetical protein